MNSGKRRSSAILATSIAVLAGCSTVPTTSVKSPAAPSSYTLVPASALPRVPGRVLVRLKPGYSVRSVQDVMAKVAVPHVIMVKTRPGETEEAAALRLMKNPAVAHAEPDYIYHSLAAMHALYMPNNPLLPKLWGMFKIDAPDAWNITKGNPNLKIAVVDTGIDYNHEAFKDGRVIKGYNFADNNDDPMDDMGHGTHVAGTIGAAGDDGIGVVGEAYKCKLIAIKVLGKDGSGSISNIADGINAAVQMGARVINLSLGGPEASDTLQQAVDNAVNKGVVVVAAAGNSGDEEDDYPAAYPDVLSVGATDQNDARASFSNYGSYVNVAAPGVNILSSTEGTYKTESGTSMASPHVTGAVALMLSVNPNLTPAQCRTILEQTGDPTTGFPDGTVNRINVFHALEDVQSGKVPAPTPTPAPATGFQNVTLQSLTASSATITWSTSSAAAGQANYTTPYYYEYGYWWTAKDSNPSSLDHSVTLSGLSAGSEYYVQLESRTTSGQDLKSTLYSFTTPQQ